MSAGGGFEAVFGRPPQASASAPGRINLLGEHTDYNDGFVLPIALHERTTVAIRRSDGLGMALHSATLGRTVRFSMGARPDDAFARYVYGCLREFAALGHPLPPLDIHVDSDVPIGLGLSSSAALEVATLRALVTLVAVDVDGVALAQMAQRAEIQDAGVNCGIMDQMASSLAGTDRALFIDTRTLVTRSVPLPAGSTLLVLDSGASHSHAESGYNRRRLECDMACTHLGVASLRDLDASVDRAAVDSLPEPLRRRVRHVLTENARVQRAASQVDAGEFGRLMNASHTSMRDDYEITVPAVDRLVASLQAHPGVHGARMTGGGFGGACIALCAAGSASQVAADVLAGDARGGGTARLLSM